MINEAIKKQMLTSADYFTAKRWEGKSIFFKLRYAYANYPEFTIASLVFFVFAPAIATYRWMQYDTSNYRALEKYRMHYTVVRDTHPEIYEITKEKEYGRHFFPRC